MASARPRTRRRARSSVVLAVALLALACLTGCARETPPSAPTLETPPTRDHGSEPKFCVETATNIPAIAEWSPIVDVVPGEPLPDSLIESLARVRLTRRWLDLPELPLLLGDFENMTVGDYEESLRSNSPDPGDAYDLALRSADGISDVPGSRNAVVYVAHLRPEDEPESWYVYDWRYELPCLPEES